jgi:uncharacterized membrane protein
MGLRRRRLATLQRLRPLHALLAYPYDVSSNLPKVIYALLAVSATIYLTASIRDQSRLSSREGRARLESIAVDPLRPRGFNDALVGSLFLAGIIAYDREHWIASSLFLGLAILYKFVPIFVVPFLCFRDRRIHWRFVGSLTVVLSLGFGVAYLEWGASLLRPFEVGAGRPSLLGVDLQLPARQALAAPLGRHRQRR